MPDSMKQQWEGFAKALHLDKLDISDTQYLEMRLAFYAGAYSLLNRVIEIGCNTVSENQGEQILQGYLNELTQFHADEVARRNRNRVCRG